MAAIVVLSQNTRMHGVFAGRTNLFYDNGKHIASFQNGNPRDSIGRGTIFSLKYGENTHEKYTPCLKNNFESQQISIVVHVTAGEGGIQDNINMQATA